MGEVKFSDLIGKTLVSISGEVGDEEMVFTTDTGEVFVLYHSQDCCESVEVEDICGDLGDLIGSPILVAEEVVSVGENPPGVPVMEYQNSFTWTFYKLSTVKGSVTIRWYGESNGYYSEGVDFGRRGGDDWKGEIMPIKIHKERRMLEAAIEKTQAGKIVWLAESSYPRYFFASAWLDIGVQLSFKMEHAWWDLGSPRYEFLLWGLEKEPEIIKGRDGLFLELYLAIREQVDAKQAMMKRETWDALVGEEKEG